MAMTTALARGLTTGRAAWIEQARQRHELFIEQPYEQYTEENHEAWRRLFARMREPWERCANCQFLDGITGLCLDPERVPRLSNVNRFLVQRTGFVARGVSGYVPAYRFFDCLRRREFPTTITVRGLDSLDYLPEPDIFHDIAGHVPMHTNRAFADALARFGEVAQVAAERAQARQKAEETLAPVIQALARFFWFTVEFGLIRTPAGLRAYGSGLLSSYGELRYALESPEVQRSPLSLDWVIHQSFEIDRFQPLLFYVQSFDHLYELVDELERWLVAGKLDHVAPGEPRVSPEDLASFLAAGQEAIVGT
jgi:phenylalanine-4-hydroxylase